MGNSCCATSCLSNKTALDFGKNTNKMDPNLKDLLNHAKENEDKVIKIQAVFKGNKARKDLSVEPKPQSSARKAPTSNNMTGT